MIIGLIVDGSKLISIQSDQSASPASLNLMSRSRLLQLAVPLVKNYGFTREALARSVLDLPPSEAHPQPLSETAVSALFGSGDIARTTLINAWLDDGICQMKAASGLPMKNILSSRLKLNEPVLQHLPEAFSILATSTSGPLPLDPRPVLYHVAKIADEACYIARDTSLQLGWYSRRASLAAIYSAAELHQLTSPNTTYNFLDSLLHGSSSLKSSLDEVNLFSSYVVKSWAGIIKSSGIF